MKWQDTPIGVIRYDELLNALLAIWKTRYSAAMTNQQNQGELSKMHELGFEEGLDAIAQIAGLEDLFEAGKATRRAKIEQKLNERQSLNPNTGEQRLLNDRAEADVARIEATAKVQIAGLLADHSEIERGWLDEIQT